MRNLLPKYFLAALILGVLTAAAWSYYLARPAPADQLDLASTTLLDTPRPLPEFALLDHHGRSVTKRDMQGKWRILFFGFTHCPAVCPNTMSLLDAVVLDPRLENNPPQVTLVSVDPERDSASRLHSYLRNFNTGFAGITGTADALAALRKALYVPLQRIATEEGYTLDHGSTLILINPQAEVAGFITPPHRVDEIAADLASIISY